MFYYVIVTSSFKYFFHDLGINGKKKTTLYYGTNNYTYLGVSISNSQGVVTTPRKTCYKKKKKAQEDEGVNFIGNSLVQDRNN